jgi:uncharacterized protein (TIGR03437 family)
MKRRAVPFPALCCLILVLTLASSLPAADPVYAGASYGLFKSTDAGATWNMLNIPLNSPFLKGSLLAHWLAMDPQNPSKIYMIGSATGIAFFASSDAGATWTITPFVGLQPTHLAVDFAGKVIYISASDTQDNLSLYKSTDTGKTWTRLILPNTQDNPVGSNPFGIPVESFFVDPVVSGTVYTQSGSGYDFFKSKDFGSTWTEVDTDQKAFKKPTYVDPHNPLIWYSVNDGLFKSTDGASTFTTLAIPSTSVTSVAVGAVSATVYATGDVAGLGATVLKSTDGGDTWTPLKNGLFTSISGVVWADPADASTVYVNDSIYTDSFYVSTDAGATFNQSKIPQGPPGCVPGNCMGQEIYSLLIAVPAATTPAPPPAIWENGVVNGASYQPGIVPNSWVSIGGTHLASKTDNWVHAIVDGKFPTELDGVSVKIGGKPAYINFISPGQINLVAPDVGFGPLPVTVTTPGGTSATFMVTSNQYGPAFFQWPDSQPIATRLDYTDAVKDGTFPGVSTVPAKPGETIVLWGTGFGPTNPIAPPGAPVPSGKTYSATTLPKVTIDKVSAKVYGAALTAGFAGLYQVAIQIPDSIRDGDWPIQATIGGVESPTGVVLTVHQ